MARTKNQMSILKIAKKKRRVTARQGEADYWTLQDMVHAGLIHKTLPTSRKAYGWPVYIISKKGLKVLDQCKQR